MALSPAFRDGSTHHPVKVCPDSAAQTDAVVIREPAAEPAQHATQPLARQRGGGVPRPWEGDDQRASVCASVLCDRLAVDSPCECEHNNPVSLIARLFPSVVLAVAPAVTMDEASSLSLEELSPPRYLLKRARSSFATSVGSRIGPEGGFELSPG